MDFYLLLLCIGWQYILCLSRENTGISLPALSVTFTHNNFGKSSDNRDKAQRQFEESLQPLKEDKA